MSIDNMMQPIVYTRPFEIGDLDYCIFAFPELIKDHKQYDRIKRNIRLIQAVEGYRGDIQCQRWHVLRMDKFLIVGKATLECGRKDVIDRPIRGYFGILADHDFILKPTIAGMTEIFDKQYVEPRFRCQKAFGIPYYGNIATSISTNLVEPVTEQSSDLLLNTDSSMLKLFGYEKIYMDNESNLLTFLNSVILASRGMKEFEMVIGLNSIRHAKELQLKNAVCMEQSDTILLPLLDQMSNALAGKDKALNADTLRHLDVNFRNGDTSRYNLWQRLLQGLMGHFTRKSSEKEDNN